ncbi:uncharacterized protein LOC107030122 [Solanum pennellii]|uniref:Uncharacterized protein LOC107030122 n=1 Tax=Solanum pennellii TaxID=28526 RepID=A0ABM1HKZ0_SOLPN|nr:uncharacterized protein LOC107030122 [Solanum pennellii]
MRFVLKWIKWIKFCISSVKFSVLINGTTTRFFGAQRGLRQNDPLSLFLFLLVMEGFNNMLKTSNTNGWLRGFDVANDGRESIEVTYLQYAGDIPIFCGVEEEQFKYLRVILILFEGISGLHISWRKNFLYPINKVHNMEALNLILGGQVGALPTTYIGMLLGAKSMTKVIWSSVIEKCEKKLTEWKG